MGRGAPRTPLPSPGVRATIPPMAKHPTTIRPIPSRRRWPEATRVLADDPDLGVTYSVDPPGLSGDSLRLAAGQPPE